MAKMSEKYWRERQHKRESKAYSKILDVEKEYKENLERAKIRINKQISHIGTKYMKENELSYKEAMRQLKGAEYKVWKKDLHEYMQELKALEKTAPLEAKKMWLEIETLSARSRISRLDSIRAQIDIELSKVSSEAVESTRKALYGIYGDTYKEVTKDLGIKSMFSENLVKEVLDRPWSGANYSSRLWGNTEKLARMLKQDVTNGMIQGINLKEMGKRVSERIEGAKRNDVERLLRTEVNYTLNQATLSGYKDAGIEKYEFDATIDSRTSQICAELNGETFELNKAAVGLNYPPMHPRCRSTTLPIIDYSNQSETPKAGTPASELSEEKELQNNKKEGIIEKTLFKNDKLKNSLNEEDYKEYSKLIDGNQEEVKKLFKNLDDIAEIRRIKNGGVYKPDAKVLEFDLCSVKEIEKGRHKYSTLSHEIGHFLDNKDYFKNLTYKETEALRGTVNLGNISSRVFPDKPSSSDEFLKALRADKEFLKGVFQESKTKLLSTYASGGVQDALDGMFGTFDNNQTMIGHGDRYYNRKYNLCKDLKIEKGLKELYSSMDMDASNQGKVKSIVRNYDTASEAWANISSAVVCGGEELEFVKEFLPNMYKTYLDILKLAK